VLTLLPSILAAFVSFATISLLLSASARLPADIPNERSLHQKPVPRGGGIAIWCGLAAALLASGSLPGWSIALAGLIVVSLWDDRAGLPVAVRFLVQFAAVGFWAGSTLPAGQVALASVVVVWAANLYNFMDGSDGLAASMGVTGFCAYAAAAWLGGSSDFPVLLAVAAAIVPFWIVNRPPARMFMGDVGSVPLGFLAGAIGVTGWSAGLWPMWFPILVFMPFIADATVTLLRRIARRERVWQAHREHYYQRLVRMGAGHRGTLYGFGSLMVLVALSACLALGWAPRMGVYVTAAWAIVIGLAFTAIDVRWNRRSDIP